MPKNLPRFTEESHGSADERARFSQWMECWALHKALADVKPDTDSDNSPESGIFDLPIATFDALPEAGEIRLLSHEITGETPRPIYVAVIHHSEDEYLIIPFGRFPDPATQGEIWTGVEDHRFDLACTWNARILPSGILEKSWNVGQVDNILRGKLHAHFKSLARGLNFEVSLLKDIGPPLHHPEDPRWDYLAEETDLLKHLDQVCLDYYAEEEVDIGGEVFNFLSEFANIRKAASDAEDRRIQVFLYPGSRAMFKAAVESSHPAFQAGTDLFGETSLLTWDPQDQNQAVGEWILEGDTLPHQGALFHVMDTKTMQWIGSGEIVDQGRVASLSEGKWSDFSAYKANTSPLLLVIFNKIAR